MGKVQHGLLSRCARVNESSQINPCSMFRFPSLSDHSLFVRLIATIQFRIFAIRLVGVCFWVGRESACASTERRGTRQMTIAQFLDFQRKVQGDTELNEVTALTLLAAAHLKEWSPADPALTREQVRLGQARERERKREG